MPVLLRSNLMIKVKHPLEHCNEAQERGLKLGNPEQFHDEGRRKGAARVKQQALASDTNKQILDTILDKVHRCMSPQQIASHLNSINLKTIRGKRFRTGTINMYLKRAREFQHV